MEKKLYRDENGKMIGGVAAGLAAYFDVDVTWVRLAFILALFAGAGFLAYLVLWIAVPAKPFMPFGPSQFNADYRVYEDKQQAQSNYSAQPPFAQQFHEKKDHKGRLVAGIVLVSIGTIFLVNQLDLLPGWFTFVKLWPLALIIPGVVMLFNANNRAAHPDSQTPASPATPAAAPETAPTDLNANENTQNN